MRYALAFWTALVGPVLHACPPKAVVQSYAVQQVVTPVVPVVQVPIALYSIQYSPPPAPQVQQQAAGDCCQQLVGELAALRAEIARLRGGAVAPATSQPVTGAGLLQTRCAACHGVNVAGAKGAGFVLTEADGSLPPLSLPEKRRILELVRSGKMPKDGHKFTDTEVKVLEEFLK